jgi:hypothetical protein
LILVRAIKYEKSVGAHCGGFERRKGLRKRPGKGLPALPTRFRAGTDTTSATVGVIPSRSSNCSHWMSRPRLAPASRVPARVPPEDVGGFGGHERFLAIMADRDDPEHADMKQWCGGHFDPGWFDLRAPTRT